MRSAITGRVVGYLAATVAVSIVSITAAARVGTFRESGSPSGSFWHRLLMDRTTVGFVRAAVVMVAIYVIASGAALVAGGRWLRSMKATGFEVDASNHGEITIASLEQQLRDTRAERDEAIRLLKEVHGG
ncbi:MAG: hypothetical protein WEB06_13780 [Actinomycetota bacterium]